MRLAVLALALGLAACDAVPEGSGTDSPARGFLAGLVPPSDGPAPGRALARVRLAQGDVVVSGPRGYCLDPDSIVNTPARGFALIASCRILTDGRGGPEVPPVLATVSVGSGGTTEALPTADALAQGMSAPLLDQAQYRDAVLVRLGAGGDTVLPQGDPTHWRAAMIVNGHLVGLAVYAPPGSGMGGSAGRAFLEGTIDRILSDSEGSAPSPDAPARTGTDPLRQLWSRLAAPRT